MPYVYIQSSLEGGNHKLIIAMVNNCLLCEAAFQLLETPLNAGFLLLAKRTKSSAVFKILGLKAAVTYQNEACFEAGQCLARFDWSVWIVSGSVTGCILFDP